MTNDNDPIVPPRRRGMLPPHIQRGTVTRIVLRSIRLAGQAARLALQVLLAVVIVFEEWGWQPLSAALARLASIQIVARLEAAVAGLSPWPALGVFLVPTLLFLPLKLIALALIAGGHVLSATALFIGAKIAGTALYARIFQLTRPALMQLSWFARGYNWFVPWKEHLVAEAKATAVWQVSASVAHRIRDTARAWWTSVRPSVVAYIGRIRAAIGL